VNTALSQFKDNKSRMWTLKPVFSCIFIPLSLFKSSSVQNAIVMTLAFWWIV